MSILKIIGAILEGKSAAEGAGDLAELAVGISGLAVAESRMEQEIHSYLTNKSETNARRIRANMVGVREYLRRTAGRSAPGVGEMLSLEDQAKYQVTTAIANQAAQLIFRIDMAVDSGSLPPLDDTPWHIRRKSYIRLRNHSRGLAAFYEGEAMRRKRSLSLEAGFEDRLRRLADADDISDSDKVEIRRDLREAESDARALRRTLALAIVLARSSYRNYERYGRLIEAGDRANRK